MGWSIEGDYVASCSCDLVCGCPVDAKPNDPRGTGVCDGVAVFHVDRGSLEGTDLSGVTFAFYNHFPSNVSAGNWRVGVIVDEAASDAQADSIGKILRGEVGGPFGDMAPLVGTFDGVHRAKLAVTATSGSIAGMSEFTYEPHIGQDGAPVEVSNAPFAFADPYRIGRTSGKTDGHGISFDSNYGESAHFTYSDSGHETVRA